MPKIIHAKPLFLYRSCDDCLDRGVTKPSKIIISWPELWRAGDHSKAAICLCDEHATPERLVPYLLEAMP